MTTDTIPPAFPTFPPGPPSFAARIAAARTGPTGSGGMFMVFLPDDGTQVVALWSMPETYFERIRPHVLRLQTDNPAQFGPLIFVTRQGQEEADYRALVAVMECTGPNYAAPIHLTDVTGYVQLVAGLPTTGGEAHNG